MKNELAEAWEERVAEDNAAIKELADKFYDGETDLLPELRVELSLQERAEIHGCCVAASWVYDHSHFFEQVVKHTGISLQTALLFSIYGELKQLNSK